MQLWAQWRDQEPVGRTIRPSGPIRLHTIDQGRLHLAPQPRWSSACNGSSGRKQGNVACRYVARIDDKVTLKLGPRYDMGGHLPSKGDGWEMVANGIDFGIWERVGA